MSEAVQRRDRYDPCRKSGYLSIQHMQRYRFALGRLEPGQKVLDVACGTGYGTALLRRHGCDVVGADVDAGQIVRNLLIWDYPGFLQADALSLPFEDESFNAVVSFETIEHVAEGDLFLSEMHRVLKPGGLFICSTPNRRYTGSERFPSRFHAREYEPEEFFDMVEAHFGSTERYGQYFRSRDLMCDAARRWITRGLGNAADCVGAKRFLKGTYERVLGWRPSRLSGPEARARVVPAAAPRAEGNESFYRVRPLGDPVLLRIMIAVAHKTEGGHGP